MLLQLLIEIIAANFPHSSTGVSLDRRKIFKHKAVDCHVACLMAGEIFYGWADLVKAAFHVENIC